MPILKHTKPCNACPWRRESAAGWLGASNPEEFIEQTLAELEMPCHCAVDYDDPAWEKNQIPNAPLCAGSLVFMRNVCKIPRNHEHAEAVKSVEADRDNVFARPDEFIAHHSK
jgi:hypothetical protein